MDSSISNAWMPHVIFLSDRNDPLWECWYNLSNLTNQRVYQELVYRNGSFKEMITGSAAPSLPSFLPFYFRVRAFSIQRARLSRSPEQAKRKQEFERVRTRKARPLSFLARLKSPFPIKGLQAIYSSKTHFKTSRALEPIVLLKIHQVEEVKQRQCEMSGGGISFQSQGRVRLVVWAAYENNLICNLIWCCLKMEIMETVMSIWEPVRATTRYRYMMTSPKFNLYLISLWEKTTKLVSVIKYYTREIRVIFTFFPNSSHFLRLLPVDTMSDKLRLQFWVVYLFKITISEFLEKLPGFSNTRGRGSGRGLSFFENAVLELGLALGLG